MDGSLSAKDGNILSPRICDVYLYVNTLKKKITNRAAPLALGKGIDRVFESRVLAGSLIASFFGNTIVDGEFLAIMQKKQSAPWEFLQGADS
jgi:hypothetical protein